MACPRCNWPTSGGLYCSSGCEKADASKHQCYKMQVEDSLWEPVPASSDGMIYAHKQKKTFYSEGTND